MPLYPQRVFSHCSRASGSHPSVSHSLCLLRSQLPLSMFFVGGPPINRVINTVEFPGTLRPSPLTLTSSMTVEQKLIPRSWPNAMLLAQLPHVTKTTSSQLIRPFKKHWLGPYSMPGTILNTWNKSMNEGGKNYFGIKQWIKKAKCPRRPGGTWHSSWEKAVQFTGKAALLLSLISDDARVNPEGTGHNPAASRPTPLIPRSCHPHVCSAVVFTPLTLSELEKYHSSLSLCHGNGCFHNTSCCLSWISFPVATKPGKLE